MTEKITTLPCVVTLDNGADRLTAIVKNDDVTVIYTTGQKPKCPEVVRTNRWNLMQILAFNLFDETINLLETEDIDPLSDNHIKLLRNLFPNCPFIP